MKKFTFENKNFCLTVREDAVAESLVYKPNGEELLLSGEDIPMFSVTQLRPFNNEIKLIYMNKRTAFQASKLAVEGNQILVDFEIVPYKAVISFEIRDEYMTFTLTDFIVPPEFYPSYMCMDLPPVEEFRLLQLPVRHRANFGQWINAVWDDTASVCVLAANPEALIDSEKHRNYRVLTATAKKEVQLKGTSAALIVSGGQEPFLGAVDSLERDLGLPLGVESRKNPILNRSVYWTLDLCPQNLDEHLKYAKMGGFQFMLLYYECMCPRAGYRTCGDYSISERFPGGYEELRETLQKIKAAGIIPGFHFLHTHIGQYTKYVTPVCDGRLNTIGNYSLAAPIGLGDEDIFVCENPKNAPMHPDRRVMRIGGELVTYEGFTTEPPYRFYGIHRGYWNTTVTAHGRSDIAAILDVSEYGASSVYIDQNSDLQDEIAQEIAKVYDCGFEFIYFDGSEGAVAPYEYHVPNAQYRVLKKLGSTPIFCEGAAKAHFNWHHLNGANAFDVFATDEFKDMLDRHPLAEAPMMEQDFSRLDFGWWAFRTDTRRDIYEYGTSRAFGWDSRISMMASLDCFAENPRSGDILEVLRRWEHARKLGLFSAEEKEQLRKGGTEHTLLINEEGTYELVPYFQIQGAFSGAADLWAYAFERCGKSYALVWHNSGSAKVKIPLSDAKYERDLGKEVLPTENTDGGIALTVEASAYLSAEIGLEAMIEAIRKASVI